MAVNVVAALVVRPGRAGCAGTVKTGAGF